MASAKSQSYRVCHLFVGLAKRESLPIRTKYNKFEVFLPLFFALHKEER